MSLLVLLKGLDKSKFKPILIIPSEGSLLEKLQQLGIETKLFAMHPMMIERNLIQSFQNAIQSFKEIKKIELLLKELKPDLVHINSYRVGIPFSIASKDKQYHPFGIFETFLSQP